MFLCPKPDLHELNIEPIILTLQYNHLLDRLIHNSTPKPSSLTFTYHLHTEWMAYI